MIKGQTYSNQLFESWAYRLTLDTLLNSNDGVLEQYGGQMQVTTSSNNIVVASGLAIIQGGIIENTSDLTLVPQLQANEYYCVVVEIDMSQTNTTESFNQGSIKLISNSGGYPTLTKQDTIQGTGIYQYELARFQTTSSAIQNLTDTRTYLNYNSLYQELQNAIDEIIQDGINASQVSYDNSTSGLPSTNVQGAIDNLTLGETELSENIRTINTSISDLQQGLGQVVNLGDFVVEQKTRDIEPSVGYNTATISQTFTKSGYKGLGCVGFRLVNNVGQLSALGVRTTAVGNGSITLELSARGQTDGRNNGTFQLSLLWVKVN